MLHAATTPDPLSLRKLMKQGRSVSFGLSGLTLQRSSAAKRGNPYEEVVDYAVAAERAGLSAAWLSEHHFSPTGYLPSPIPVMGALASATSRIRIGTSVLLVPLYDPLRLAEDLSVVDNLSGGRVTLGAGQGYRPEELAAFGQTQRGLGDAFERSILYLKDAWAGTPVVAPAATVNNHRPQTKVSVHPQPVQRGGPPVWIGGFRRRAIERAARIADGYIAPAVGLEKVGRAIEAIGEIRVLDGFSVGVIITVFVGDIREFDMARHAVAEVDNQYQSWLSSSHTGKDGGPSQAALGTSPPAAIGTAEQCITILQPWYDLLRSLPGEGEAHLALRATFPSIDIGRNIETINRIVQDVVPALEH